MGIADAFEARGQGPAHFIELAPGDAKWGVLEVTARQVRSISLEVERDGDDHALIVPPPTGKKSRELSKNIAVWIQLPKWP